MMFTNFSFLSEIDVCLLWTCALIAGIASLIRAMVSETDLDRLPDFKQIPANEREVRMKQTKDNRRERSYSLMVMLLAGAAVGLAVAFLFIGVIQPHASSIGRIWFLSLILGFTTPKVLNHVRRRVEQTLQGVEAQFVNADDKIKN